MEQIDVKMENVEFLRVLTYLIDHQHKVRNAVAHGRIKAERASTTRNQLGAGDRIRETWQFCRSERNDLSVSILTTQRVAGSISSSMLAGICRHFILAVVVVAIVMVVVCSIAHIKASTRMVPVPISFADSNSNAADSDIGAFRDDHWFVADVQRTGKCRHSQKRNKKKGKHTSLHDVLLR